MLSRRKFVAAAAGTALASGVTATEAKEPTDKTKKPKQEKRTTIYERMAITDKIGYLLDELRDNPERDDVKKEIRLFLPQLQKEGESGIFGGNANISRHLFKKILEENAITKKEYLEYTGLPF